MAFAIAFIVALVLAGTSIFGIFVLAAFVHDDLIFFPAITGDMMSILEWWHPIVFVMAIGVCWFLAGLSENMYLINESGTKLFGHTTTPNGYIATKWICLTFLPLLPVNSYEIVAEQDGGLRTDYVMRKLDELYWPQIVQTAVKGLFSLVGVIVGMAIIFNAILLFVL